MRFYRHLCLSFHPDKQSLRPDKRHSDRLGHLFQLLSGVYAKYPKGERVLDPPDAAAFEALASVISGPF